MSKLTKRVWLERNGKGWRVRFRESAQGPQKTAKTVRTKREGLAIVREIERTIVRESYPGSVIPLWSLAEDYVKERVTGGFMSAGNGVTTEKVIELFCERMKVTTVLDVTPTLLQQWADTYPTKGTWRYVRAVLRWSMIAKDQPLDPKVIARAPTHTTSRKRVRDEPELLDDEMVKVALERATDFGEHAGAVVHFLATYGCRPITCMHMQVRDVDMRNGTMFIRHNKNKIQYKHPLTDRTLKLLKPLIAGRDSSERLFLDPRTGKPWVISKQGCADSLSNWYPNYCSYDFADPLKGIYSLKDWAITKMVHAQIPDHEIILFTGHKNTDVLKKYKKSNMDRAKSLLCKLPAV